MRSHGFHRIAVACILTCALMTACGGGGSGAGGMTTPQTYSVGGSVAGLAAGESVKLADNGNDILTVSSDQTFVFATKVAQSGSYAVTVTGQPKAQQCTVTAGSGANVMANVTNVAVTCTNLPQYAYVVNDGDDTVSQYAIDASGTLSE